MLLGVLLLRKIRPLRNMAANIKTGECAMTVCAEELLGHEALEVGGSEDIARTEEVIARDIKNGHFKYAT